ncbi:MAG: hypothetical protein ABI421_21055 [Polyangiaceae bacterium]
MTKEVANRTVVIRIRRGAWLLFVMLAACASTSPSTHATSNATGPSRAGTDHAGVRADLHCTQASEGAESACSAKGADCHLRVPLRCSGTPPPPDVVAAWEKQDETSSAPCTCVCSADERLCSELP